MDSRNNFINNFNQWIKTLDEDFLISISNKGTYKRALKELENGCEVKYEYLEDSVRVKAGEDECEFNSDINNFKCTCPSRSVCKHVIMGLIYIMKNIDSCISGNTEESSSENAGGIDNIGSVANVGNIGSTDGSLAYDFTEALGIELKEIKKRITPKEYKDILLRLQFGVETSISEAAFITINYVTEGISVRIPQKDVLRTMLCSCKQSLFCKHRAEAILIYQISKGVLKIKDLLEQEGKSSENKIPTDVLENVKKLLNDIMVLGLARIFENVPEKLESMAVICHSFNLPYLEKLLRSLSTELNLHFLKNVTFERKQAFELMSKIYNIVLSLQSIEKDNNDNSNNKGHFKKLIGEHRTTYFSIPQLILYGMGTEAWRTKSGYEGLTVYFWENVRKQWFTYTYTMPTYYEGNSMDVNKVYNFSNDPWKLKLTYNELSKSNISLNNVKINEECRISSSEECSGKFMESTNIDKLSLETIMFDDWNTLIEKIKDNFYYCLYKKPSNCNLVLLKVSKWGQAEFDKTTQFYSQAIFDKQESKINIRIPYSSSTKCLIERLERLQKIEKRKEAKKIIESEINNSKDTKTELGYPEMILVRVFMYNAELSVIPISGYYNDDFITDLSL